MSIIGSGKDNGYYRHGGCSGRISPSYRSWVSMIQRCTNPKAAMWQYYGGRGIEVCARWKDFANFLADMGERPSGKTLDRINGSLGYEPGNCRWATPKEQAKNRRPGGPKRIDMTGHRSGRLVVLSFSRSIKRRSMWRCLCDCGAITEVAQGDLKSLHSRSCGCLQRETRMRRSSARSPIAAGEKVKDSARDQALDWVRA